MTRGFPSWWYPDFDSEGERELLHLSIEDETWADEAYFRELARLFTELYQDLQNGHPIESIKKRMNFTNEPVEP